MRLLPIAGLALAACAGSYAPVSFMSPTPRPADEAYTCALRTVNQLGYTIEATDRTSGFLRAGRQSSGAMAALLVERDYFDGLTVSIFEAADGTYSMRVTAASSSQGSFNSTGRNNVPPSQQVQRDAREVLGSCGDGAIQGDGVSPCNDDFIGAWRQADGSWAVIVNRPGTCETEMCDLTKDDAESEDEAMAVCARRVREQP